MATRTAKPTSKRPAKALAALRGVRELIQENRALQVGNARPSRNLAASTATVKELGRKLKQAEKRNQ